MFDNKKYKLKTPRKTTRPKKPKKEKSAEKKMGGGKLLGGKFFQKESFGKASLGKPSFSEKTGKWPQWLKWWHILLAVLGTVIIAFAVMVGVIVAQMKADLSGGGGPLPEPEGTITSTGTFLSQTSGEYVLCEYTEYFSGEKRTILQLARDVRYDYKPYYILIYDGQPVERYSGEYTGEYTQEQTKEGLLSLMKSVVGYTDEQLARCDVHIYEPVGFTRVKISEATLAADGTASITYSAGAVDGELVEYTLTGTYEKGGNDFAFAYENLPEDEHLARVAEVLLGSAKYKYYDSDNVWINALTFDTYTLVLTTPDTPAE